MSLREIVGERSISCSYRSSSEIYLDSEKDLSRYPRRYASHPLRYSSDARETSRTLYGYLYRL